ncbi:MAG: Tryptophan--tRNA ligase [Candidatus Taylorbacteria bacterium]|nr:Tryptophan--tRNA ligase [Candidatus Taylorbacteria bacterium]
MTKKRLLSGIKSTGRTHIGNYFGAMKQWVDLVNDYDSFIMVADYHSLNFVQNAGEMRDLTWNMVIDYLAVGLDPKKVVIFKQSDVSAHTELCWIFDTLITMPFLMRAHAFKDAEAKDKEISVGTFNYPVLMAADILLYGPDVVPVGQDQKQHVEYARDIAEKFNHIFGETFKLPKEMIVENVAVVPGIDGRKMSKSYNNYIPLFAGDDEIEKLCMAIVTDSSGDVPTNVYAIHKLFRSEEELKAIYDEHKGKYKILKEKLIEDVKAFIKPLRDKRRLIAEDTDYIRQVIKEGGERAKEIANKKLVEVKEKIGVN